MPASSAKPIQISESRLNVDAGVVNEGITRGISPWTFFFVCCNIVISQVLSIPFMFTTAGWVSLITETVAAALAFICIQLVRVALKNEQVVRYAEQKCIPPFEREYTFLGEFCAGNLGRAGITLLIFLEYYTGLSTIFAAIGLCVELLIPQVKAEYWIIVFGILTLILVLVPWLREVSTIIGVIAMIGTIGSMLAWVGSAFAILPESNLNKNFMPRDPLFINIVNAGSLSIWTFAGAPSIPPYTGVLKGSSDRRTTFIIFICFVITLFYVAIIGIGGMQICDGICDPFYPKSLEDTLLKVPMWLIYFLYVFMLMRLIAMAQIGLVPLMISTERFLGNALVKSTYTANVARQMWWRLVARSFLVGLTIAGAILAKRQLAQFQAIASDLLTSCTIYLFPLWFYVSVVQPSKLTRYTIYFSGIMIIAFIATGTAASIMERSTL